MIKENSEIKSPNDILRNRKRSLRDRLQLAIYEFPPDYFTVTFADPNNAVLITEGEAGREAYFVYGRFKSKELHRKEGLPHNQPDGAAAEARAQEVLQIAQHRREHGLQVVMIIGRVVARAPLRRREGRKLAERRRARGL